MLTLFLSLALSTSTAEPATDAKPATSKPPKPKLICRSEENARGRIPKRVCKAQEDWDAQPGNVTDELQTKSSNLGG